jgi:holo-[acyl-carrier protein] synthase
VIFGLGIDSVEISRFASWTQYDAAQLQKVFSHEEIAYCLELPSASAQRLAVRFAIREALFKALAPAMQKKQIPFFALCRAVRVLRNEQGVPELVVDFEAISKYIASEVASSITPLVSLTHTKTIATAIVLLQKG